MADKTRVVLCLPIAPAGFGDGDAWEARRWPACWPTLIATLWRLPIAPTGFGGGDAGEACGTSWLTQIATASLELQARDRHTVVLADLDGGVRRRRCQ